MKHISAAWRPVIAVAYSKLGDNDYRKSRRLGVILDWWLPEEVIVLLTRREVSPSQRLIPKIVNSLFSVSSQSAVHTG